MSQVVQISINKSRQEKLVKIQKERPDLKDELIEDVVKIIFYELVDSVEA